MIEYIIVSINMSSMHTMVREREMGQFPSLLLAISEKLQELINYEVSVMTFKSLNDLAPLYANNVFTRHLTALC